MLVQDFLTLFVLTPEPWHPHESSQSVYDRLGKPGTQFIIVMGVVIQLPSQVIVNPATVQYIWYVPAAANKATKSAKYSLP
jgi:hypothetical protein